MEAVFRWRWPNGFVSPRCSHSGHCRVQSRCLYQCSGCRYQASLTARTILASTKLALRTWFLAMYLMTQTKNGVSALELSRQLAVSYNTAWKVKHKLMQVMKERDDTRPLGGWVQLDDAYWGGQRRGGKSGRGAPVRKASSAAEPATRTSSSRPSDVSSAPARMTSASAITPSSPRTIRAERSSWPGSLAARQPLPGLIDAGTSRSMANSVVVLAEVGRCVTHTPTLSPSLGRKPACVNACSRGGVSPRAAGSMARSPSVVCGPPRGPHRLPACRRRAPRQR